MLTEITTQYQAAAGGWMSAGLAYAIGLFLKLAVIEIAVFSIYELFKRDGLAEFLSSFLIKMLGLLFCYTLLIEAPAWIPAIVASFTKAGSAIGHVNSLDPSAVIDKGIEVANIALEGINDASIWNSLPIIAVAGLSALVIVFSFAVIGCQFFITLIESTLIISGGMFLLGFLGTRFTTSIPERYFGYVISVSIKLFVIFLIVGLGDTLGQHLKEVLTAATQNGAIPAPGVYLEVMAGALTYMILAWHLPSLAGSMLSGAPALTLGAAATTTAMLTAAVSNGVIQGMRQMAANPRQATNALAGAVKLGQAAKMGIGEKLRGGASLSSAVGNTLGDISLTASQQFRDSVIRGTGRESAAAAEKAAGDNAVQGWGRGTTLGNLTNRMHANRDGASIETKAGDTGAKGATGGVNRITPPPIPNDQTHGSGNITIRFKE